jgi:hypothetical protein
MTCTQCDGVEQVFDDASSPHLAVAREETSRRGHDASVEFVRGDFVAMAKSVSVADVVTLDRVICCYDDMQGLVSHSADKATQFYGAVYPRQVAWMRIGIACINLIQRLKRTTFRGFLHDPSSIDGVLRDRGLERTSIRRTLGWESSFMPHNSLDRLSNTCEPRFSWNGGFSCGARWRSVAPVCRRSTTVYVTVGFTALVGT